MANGDPIIIPRKGTRTKEKGGVRTVRPTKLGVEYSDLQASDLFQDYPGAIGELAPTRVGRTDYESFRGSADPGKEMLAGLPMGVRKSVIEEFQNNPQLASVIVGDLDYGKFPTSAFGINPNLLSVLKSGGSGILLEELFDPTPTGESRGLNLDVPDLAGINISVPSRKKTGPYVGAGRKPKRYKSGAVKRTGRGDRPVRSIRRR